MRDGVHCPPKCSVTDVTESFYRGTGVAIRTSYP